MRLRQHFVEFRVGHGNAIHDISQDRTHHGDGIIRAPRSHKQARKFQVDP